MRVTFLAGTLARGGAERQLLYMLRAARSAGVRVSVLSLTRGESYESEIESLGIPVHWVGNSPNRWKRLWNIVRHLREHRTDVFQSSHFFTNIYAGMAGKFLRIPSIGAVRSDLFSEMRFHSFLGSWQVSLPFFLIVNSKFAYERALGRGISPEKIEFVRNVVEGEKPAAEKARPRGKNVRLLFVGRLDKNKRPEKFIDLAAALVKRFPALDLSFQIAGDGELRAELEKRALNSGLTPGKFEFSGVCSNMNAVYSQADILVSTSVREGTSNVILEAMAHGLPVIATRVGGTPDILSEDRGILIDPASDEQLHKAAETLILNAPARARLGANGRKYVEQNHSLEYLQKHLTDVYKKLAAPAGQS
jgi:glycosyltransferase involved in cell wall biosynthesis